MKIRIYGRDSYRYRAICGIPLMLISCILCQCDGGEKVIIAPQLDPGVVNFLICDNNGNPLAAPSIGGILIEIANANIDVSKTAECNNIYSFYDSYKVSETPEKYLILIIAGETQCDTDTIGSAYMNDRSDMDKIANSIIAICSADNVALTASQYSLKLLPK